MWREDARLSEAGEREGREEMEGDNSVLERKKVCVGRIYDMQFH